MSQDEDPQAHPYRDVDPALAVQRDLLAEAKQYAHRLVTERDRLQERVEQLERTVEFWSRVEGYMPVVGVTCDGEGCKAAIGVVGIKAAPTDELAQHAADIGVLVGWVTDRTFDEVAQRVVARHYCPKCKERP